MIDYELILTEAQFQLLWGQWRDEFNACTPDELRKRYGRNLRVAQAIYGKLSRLLEAGQQIKKNPTT